MIEFAPRLQGVTTYYFAEKLAQIREMEREGVPVINLGIGSPDRLPPPEVIEKLRSVAHDAGVNMYQSYRSLPTLRAAFTDWYAKHFKVTLDPETELLPLMGSKEGIMHIAMSFLGEGDQALVPDPGYPAYAAATELAGAEALLYPLEKRLGWRPDLSALSRLDLSKVKIMWLNYPNMPTGALADPKFFDELIAFAKANDLLLCHDNPYAFILNDHPMSILERPEALDHAIELNSLSKSYNMAGWRVGSLAGRKDYIDGVLTFKSNMDSGMYKGIQEAAVLALQQDATWFTTLNDEYRQRREWAYGIMDLLGCSYEADTAGLFVWAEIPEEMGLAEAYSEEILIASKVFITPGMVFGKLGAKHLRISLCGHIDMFKEAHERIRQAIASRDIHITST